MNASQAAAGIGIIDLPIATTQIGFKHHDVVPSDGNHAGARFGSGKL
jgi:hypothetical protein